MRAPRPPKHLDAVASGDGETRRGDGAAALGRFERRRSELARIERDARAVGNLGSRRQRSFRAFDADGVPFEPSVHIPLDLPTQGLVDEIGEDKDNY